MEALIAQIQSSTALAVGLIFAFAQRSTLHFCDVCTECARRGQRGPLDSLFPLLRDNTNNDQCFIFVYFFT